MNHGLRRGLGVVLALLVLGVLIVPKLISMNRSEPAPASAPEARVLEVETFVVGPESLIERLSTTGTLRANERVEVVSEIAGKVVEILFEEGRRVAGGQVLVRIDATELTAERQRILHQRELAERREVRQRELRDSGVLSEQDYDFALSQLHVLDSELALVEARLEKTEIRAPFAGIVGLRYASLGTYLTPQTRIASLQSLDPVKIDFSVPERYAGQLRPGVEIRFRLAGFDEELRGEVYAVEPAVDLETRSLLLRARSANPGGLLLPGAFADIDVVIRQVDDALAVPSLAVIPELGGKKVFVYEDGVAQVRRVETGLRGAERVEILSGLEPGDRVIVSAIQQLRPGLAVRTGE